jgi:hypothetical protein
LVLQYYIHNKYIKTQEFIMMNRSRITRVNNCPIYEW